MHHQIWGKLLRKKNADLNFNPHSALSAIIADFYIFTQVQETYRLKADFVSIYVTGWIF